MILYGSSISPFVRKVLAFAAEKSIDLESKPVGPGDQSPEFRAASPFGKMPAFADGEFRLADSSAIIHYLEAKHPEPALIPCDPQQRGRTIWFDEFGDTILATCAAKIFFNRLVAPRFLNRPGDEDAAAKAERDELPPIMDYLESVVPGDDGYLVGDSLTLADLAVASPFANLSHLGCEYDRSRHGRACAYIERILARPSFTAWTDRETAFLARTPA